MFVLFVVIAMAMIISPVLAEDVVVLNMNNDQEMVVGEALNIKGLYRSSNIGWYALNTSEIIVPEDHPKFKGEWIEVPSEDIDLLLLGFSEYQVVCTRIQNGETFTMGTWNEARDVIVATQKEMVANDYSYQYYLLKLFEEKLVLEEIESEDHEDQFLFSIMRQPFTREDSDYTSYLVKSDESLSYIKYGRLERIVENYHSLNIGNSILFLLSQAGITD